MPMPPLLASQRIKVSLVFAFESSGLSLSSSGRHHTPFQPSTLALLCTTLCSPSECISSLFFSVLAYAVMAISAAVTPDVFVGRSSADISNSSTPWTKNAIPSFPTSVSVSMSVQASAILNFTPKITARIPIAPSSSFSKSLLL